MNGELDVTKHTMKGSHRTASKCTGGHNSQPEKTGNSERFYEDKVREVTHYGKGSKKRNRQISFKGK